MALNITVNGESLQVDDRDAEMPLLWYLRDHAGLTGTKFGCGRGLCGACTVLVDGSPIRGCLTQVRAAEGRAVTTIESVGQRHDVLRRVWVAQNVAQCGYCQSGQIVAAAALLDSNPNPSDTDIDAAMAGNICRCGTYTRIRKAIKTAATEMSSGNGEG